jgi:predicted HTH transcriptional regulator
MQCLTPEFFRKVNVDWLSQVYVVVNPNLSDLITMRIIRPKSSSLSLCDLVAEGEGLHTEFKRLINSAPKIARSLSAFANTAGGTILVGVDDDKRVVGIRSEKETLQIIDEALRFHIEPKPEIELYVEVFKSRMVLVVVIPESPERPHFHIEERYRYETGKPVVARRVFIREGSQNRAASEERIALMLASTEPVKLSFSEREQRLLAYLSEHGRITTEEFARLAAIPLQEARRILVLLVRAGTIQLLTEETSCCYTLFAG